MFLPAAEEDVESLDASGTVLLYVFALVVAGCLGKAMAGSLSEEPAETGTDALKFGEEMHDANFAADAIGLVAITADVKGKLAFLERAGLLLMVTSFFALKFDSTRFSSPLRALCGDVVAYA